MLTQVKSTKKTNDIPKSPFAKKWQQIEKKQKRNATAKAKIDKLYQEFQDDILPKEQRIVKLLAEETRHLMTFLPRKSFTQWQREELQEWVESNLNTLASHPFGNRDLFETVAKEYSDSLAKEAKKINADHDFSLEEIEYMRTMADEMFNGDIDFSNDELIEFMRDPAVFQQAFRQYMEEKAQEEQEKNFDDDFTNESDEGEHFQEEHDYSNGYSNGNQRYQDEQQAKKQEKLKSLFSSSKLNKLFKMLANKLHPDKEANEHLKEEKSELMAKLVSAKKNKDAFIIISMFHQFMPESDNALFDGNDEELTQALIGLLNDKLHQLDKENSDNKYNNGIKSMVWQKLNGRSKKATQENIDCHLADLEDSHTRLNYSIHEIKTVKLLKEILGERYEQRNFNPFDGGDFSLDDLDALFR